MNSAYNHAPSYGTDAANQRVSANYGKIFSLAKLRGENSQISDKVETGNELHAPYFGRGKFLALVSGSIQKLPKFAVVERLLALVSVEKDNTRSTPLLYLIGYKAKRVWNALRRKLRGI